jgi:hypothetical protein
MKRREFLGSMAATAVLPLYAKIEEKPIMRFGLMTDTHVKNNKASCAKVGQAWKLFRREQCDVVANLGDIADIFYPKGYEGYSETVEEVWPRAEKDHPREIYVFAWHDYYCYKGDRNRSTPKWKEACAEAAKLLKSPNGLYDSFELKGYPFVVVPQWVDFKEYERLLTEASAKHPGKPIFVFDHIPPFETVYNSRIWGDRRRLELLSKFPDVIDITGHVHQSLRIDTSIWQGDFTVLNCGALSTWGGNLVGTAPKRKNCTNVIVMDVYRNRLVARRFDIRTGKEICADVRWTIPLPFSAKTAPYAIANRKKTFPAAAFPKGAVLSATPDATPMKNFLLSFPEAKGEGSFEYRIEIERKNADGTWKAYARHDIFADFWLEDFEKTGKATHSFPAGYFTEGEHIRFRITPVNAFGRAGVPIMAEATVPAKAENGMLVWKSDNPMKDCPCMTGLKGGEPLKLVDGFYEHAKHEARLMLPKGVWDGPAGTKFRFTIDLHMIQPGGGQWTLVLRNPKPLQNANQRIATPKGDSGLQRYVLEFEKPKDEYDYYFLVREGTPGKIRFEYVQIERLS